MAEPVYGFSKQDADNLLNSLDGTPPEIGIGGGVVHYLRMYKFTTTETMSGGSASATIETLNASPDVFDGTVVTYLNAFDALDAGTPGLCVYQDDQFIILQAEC